MSRTRRKMRGVKYREGKKPFYKCKCDYCITHKDTKRALTIKEELLLN